MQTRRRLEPQVESKQIEPQADMDISRKSIGELLGQLANNSAALVRDEISLARQEMAEKIKFFRSGVVTVAIGAVVGLIAVLTLTAAAVIGLAHLMDAGYDYGQGYRYSPALPAEECRRWIVGFNTNAAAAADDHPLAASG